MINLVVTCEHGGNQIPEGFNKYITDIECNNTHRAYDEGAHNLYRAIARNYSDFSRSSKISRLLIDFNRSLHNRTIYSEFSKNIPAEKREGLVKMYNIYRKVVTRYIKQIIDKESVIIHFSIHTFVPILDGIERNNDIGILFDPKNEFEKSLALRWKTILKGINPAYKVRFNYPYLGASDGFTTHLRKMFSKNYLGLELEINQKHVKNNKVNHKVKKTILKSIEILLSEYYQDK